MSEAFLEALGVHRFPLPIPFVDAGGPVNVYAIENEDGAFTLFDAGLKTPQALAALEASAAAAGVELGRVSRIVVSHGHVDHYGLAQLLAERSGAAVWIHPADRDKVTGAAQDPSRTKGYAAYFRRLGVEADVVPRLFAARDQALALAERIPQGRLSLLADGDRLRFKAFEAQVLHLPGHTAGLVCLWAPEQRLLFADDHVLAKVSPNPSIELGPGGEEDAFHALVSYLQSVRRVLALDVEWVLPGHGPAFQGHRAVLEDLFRFYEQRQERLLKRLAKGESPAAALLNAVAAQVDPLRFFLMLSEVVGNLQVLQGQGRVRRRLEGEMYLYSAVG